MAQALLKYQKNKAAIVLGIPRGGVIVALKTAENLELPFDLIIIRKLPSPDNPEAGMGAISETNEIVWQNHSRFYPPLIVSEILEEQKREIEKRIKIFRKKGKLKNLASRLKNKIAILIDDGLAMGSTMEAAVKTARKLEAKKIIVAVPVAAKEVLEKMKNLAEEVVCLETPDPFYAVSQGYEHFPAVFDEEALELIKESSFGKKYKE